MMSDEEDEFYEEDERAGPSLQDQRGCDTQVSIATAFADVIANYENNEGGAEEGGGGGTKAVKTASANKGSRKSGRRRLPRSNGEVYPSDLCGTSMMEMFSQMKRNYAPLGFFDTCDMARFQAALCAGGRVKPPPSLRKKR